MENRIRIGVSACLLGQPVRFGGSHKHDRYLTGTLGEYLDFVPVCPEVEAGFPIPRETFPPRGRSRKSALHDHPQSGGSHRAHDRQGRAPRAGAGGGKPLVRKYDQPCLKQQVYLNRHPLALKLRNHA